MPTASEDIRRGFGFRRSRIPGVYRLPKLDRTGLIVVHQLEVKAETLWLRVLGRSGNQTRAIQELVAQPARSASNPGQFRVFCYHIENIRKMAAYRPSGVFMRKVLEY
jgi:hypothetical protein